MRKAIERYEKKVGPMRKEYGIESIESNRRGGGFFDYCVLTAFGFPGLTRTVNHEGEIF